MSRLSSGNRSSIQRLRRRYETTTTPRALRPRTCARGVRRRGLPCGAASPPRPSQGGPTVPQSPDALDAVAVRAWCSLALEALGRQRAAIDAINVYPVADGDTGTNLYFTVESAAAAVEAVFAAHETGPTVPAHADVVRAMAHGALIGARGNSGTILAQLLRGMAGVLAEAGDAPHLRTALAETAAAAAAEEAGAAPAGAGLTAVLDAAYAGALAALAATPGQLAALGRAGVV